MPRNRLVVSLVSCIALGAAAGSASAAEQPNASTSSIRLTGGTHVNSPVCGSAQDTMRVREGATAAATVRGAKTRAGRRARRGTKIAIDRCEAGRWIRVTSTSLGVRRRAKRVVLPSSKDRTGDYRVRILNRRNRGKGKAALFRVGEGEIVDLPVTFTVNNSNRTLLPCLGAPDNGTYQIKGHLVAPRARLGNNLPTVDDSNAALYYHGFGYSEFFWRFKDVPGYDYGLEQAKDGHISVTVDRLGYGESGGPADANKICYSSQADIADQLIRQLKNGGYRTSEGEGPRFDRVALVGHSAGAFIAQTAQGTFQSADALVMAGFNNAFFSPLAGAYLVGSNLQCYTDQKTGSNGSRNNASYGESDADFIRGHTHNMDPAVQAALLKRRTTDPCGDVTSIPPSFLYNQGAVRAINDPLLIIAGTDDAFFPPPGTDAQAQQIFSPFAAGVTRAIQIRGSGHAVTLERTHEQFRLEMHDFFVLHGF